MIGCTDVGELRKKLHSLDTEAKAMGGGVAVLAALGFGDLTAKFAEVALKYPIAVFVTAYIFAGYCLARSWIASHAGIGTLVGLPNTNDLTGDISRTAYGYYRSSVRWARATRFLIAIAALAYLSACLIWTISREK